MIATVIRPSTGQKYTITNEHSASSYGIPVVLDNAGNLINFAEPRGYIGRDASDSAGDTPATPAEEFAASMESLRIGLEAGAMDDPQTLKMVQAAYYGRGMAV